MYIVTNRFPKPNIEAIAFDLWSLVGNLCPIGHCKLPRLWEFYDAILKRTSAIRFSASVGYKLYHPIPTLWVV